MRILEMMAIFSDPTLQEVLVRSEKNGNLSTRDMTITLLRDAAWAALLPGYVKSLAEMVRFSLHKTNCLTLIRRLHEALSNCHEFQRDKISKVLEKEGLGLKRVDISTQFQKDTLSLEQLSEHITNLRDTHHRLARAKIAEIDEVATTGLQFSTAFHKKTQLSPHVNANLFTSDIQNFILAAMPATMHEVQHFFQAAIDKGTTLFISAHNLFDGAEKKKISKFWMQHEVSRITLNNNITIRNFAPKLLGYSKTNDRQEAWPLLIESTLELSDGRKLRHIHYKSWQDGQACPDNELLEILFNRMEELSPDPKAPISINCHGGIGRTGAIAVSYYLRRFLNTAIQTEPLDSIRVNIPRTILQFRECRSQMVENHLHYITIHSMVNRHYYTLLQKPMKDLTGLPDELIKAIASFNIS